MSKILRPAILPIDLISHMWNEVQKQHSRRSRGRDLTLKKPSLKEPRGDPNRPTSSDDDEESQYAPLDCEAALPTSESESVEEEYVTMRRGVSHERGLCFYSFVIDKKILCNIMKTKSLF